MREAEEARIESKARKITNHAAFYAIIARHPSVTLAFEPHTRFLSTMAMPELTRGNARLHERYRSLLMAWLRARSGLRNVDPAGQRPRVLTP